MIASIPLDLTPNTTFLEMLLVVLFSVKHFEHTLDSFVLIF